jgi:hypothetical protein
MADQQLQSQKDPSLYRLPPQSIEAEESLLSAILVGFLSDRPSKNICVHHGLV